MRHNAHGLSAHVRVLRITRPRVSFAESQKPTTRPPPPPPTNLHPHALCKGRDTDEGVASAPSPRIKLLD